MKALSWWYVAVSVVLAFLIGACVHSGKAAGAGADNPGGVATAVAGQHLEEAQRDLAASEARLPQEKAQRPTLLTQVSRLSFLVGDLGPKEKREPFFEKGRSYAETLAQEQPDWVDGHYWLALNLCGLAECGSAKRGLKLLPEIVTQLEKALEVDPTYDQGGPHRVLGRIYHEAPAWPLSVGDPNKALHHLQKAVQIAPDNSTNHLYLGEALDRMGKKQEARREFEQVLRSIRHALGPAGLEEDYQEARRHLGYGVKAPAAGGAGEAAEQ
jgi:tetratricopeptide (TPR) repeat protein